MFFWHVFVQELGPLIRDIEQSMLALVSAYYSFPSSQGVTLRKLIADTMVSLSSSMQCLLRALDSKGEGQRLTIQFVFLSSFNQASLIAVRIV